jgi:putative flippase GtrA
MNGGLLSTQLLRYALVGVGSNLALYAGYLGLTMAGMGHKTAMTLLYVVGVLQTFYFNRGWTFSHAGRPFTAFLRYLTAYAMGYLFNLFFLWLGADQLHLPHQWVQAAAIVIVALYLFLTQRYWVFAPSVAGRAS